MDSGQVIADIINRRDWRREMAREETAAAARLTEAYTRILPRLEREAEKLVQVIVNEAAAGRTPSAEDVRALDSYVALLAQIRAEMQDFSAILRNEMTGLSEGAIVAGINAAENLVMATSGNAAQIVAGVWVRPDPAAIANAVNYLTNPAMTENFLSFGENAAQNFEDVTLSFIAQGKNPRFIARTISEWYAVPYSWADNMARTVQVWSYRTATHATYRTNGDVVAGWMWIAALDPRTCISCVLRHGSIHTNDEILNDHHRGRCAPVPIVRGTTWWQSYETGEDWLRRQPEDVQRAQFHNHKLYDAWKAGTVQSIDLSRTYVDPVYGEMVTAASYRGLMRR